MLCVKWCFSTFSEATLFLMQFSSSLAAGALFVPSVLVFYYQIFNLMLQAMFIEGTDVTLCHLQRKYIEL